MCVYWAYNDKKRNQNPFMELRLALPDKTGKQGLYYPHALKQKQIYDIMFFKTTDIRQ